MRQIIIRYMGRYSREGHAFSKSSRNWASKTHLVVREKSKEFLILIDFINQRQIPQWSVL